MSHVRVTIDRLVLKGIDPGDGRVLADALQAELTRVLADPSLRREWSHSHRSPVMRLGRIPLEPGPSGGRRFGTQMARAIGRGRKP